MVPTARSFISNLSLSNMFFVQIIILDLSSLATFSACAVKLRLTPFVEGYASLTFQAVLYINSFVNEIN